MLFLNKISLIFLALLFLALNSIFCKLALLNEYIDAYSFSFYRLLFASLVLIFLYYFKNRNLRISLNSNWLGSLMLFIYIICFSYAYIGIDAGFGTLLLFGIVQIFLFIASIFYKEKINTQKVVGLFLAFLGLVILLYPNDDFKISYFHAFMMIFSGIGWAFYTLFGNKSNDSLKNNTDSFIKATILICLSYALFIDSLMFVTFEGLLLAFFSGAITSALGYVLWYKIVSTIDVFTSSIIQLFIPLIAIFISIVYLDERVTLNLFLSSILIFLGVFIAIKNKIK